MISLAVGMDDRVHVVVLEKMEVGELDMRYARKKTKNIFGKI